ncbi:MAG: penicillin-binding protein 2 [Candidatus Babeliales bacterium]
MTDAYKFRSSLIFVCCLLAYSALICALYYTQIAQHAFYVSLGSQQYDVKTTAWPERASILDCKGRTVALNSRALSAFVVPNQIKDKKKLHAFLRAHFPAALKRLHEHTNSSFMFIKRRLNEQEQALIQKQCSEDIHLLEEPTRYYPAHSLASIVGITDIDNKGLFGIEKIYNGRLAGSPTTYALERDARSGHFYFNRSTTQQGKQPEPITLTIDAQLQHFAFSHLQQTVQQWEAKEGAVLIIDPSTGGLLAMAQYPSPDPHHLSLDDQRHVNNKALTDAYELGSVMKVCTALAALDEKVVSLEEPIDCLDQKEGFINGFKISTWRAHGVLPFSKVIELSNNFGIVTVALRLGTKLYDHYRRIGFGTKTALRWPGEQNGFVNPPKLWSRRSIISLSFGYEITATLAQLAQLFVLIANRGIARDLRIITDATPSPERRLYSTDTIDQLRTILERTVSQGTARKASVAQYSLTNEVKILGKTGTANLVIDGVYQPTHDTYTFACSVEKGDYKRVIVTFIKEVAQTKDIYASSVAVPLAEKIIEDMILYEKQF